MPSRIAKLALLLMLALVSPTAVKSPAQASPADRSTQLAKSPFEVRLRKLHLVRPDLIPYPIYFDVYC